MTELEPSASGGKLFIIARRCGRLANRLVLFANFIGLAKEQGHRVINIPFHSYANLFETTRRDLYCAWPVAPRKRKLDLVPGMGEALRRTRLLLHLVRAASAFNESVPLLGPGVLTLRESPKRTLLESAEIQERIRPARTV